ncbi:MAG TPA: acyloxyacyl hydrolase [Ignavibacteriaceae bacterium]|nr:acyloxyacyl hydrolase [Ignavibacteriaceae bacterium]
MKLFLSYFLLLLTLNCSLVFSQEHVNQSLDKDSTQVFTAEKSSINLIGGSFLYGYMIPHAKEVLPVRGLNPRGHELIYNWHLNNDDVWNDCECYPRFGFFLSYYDFDLEELLGHGFSAGMMFTYFFGLPSEFNFHLKGRGGVSYLTNPFDRNQEPVNWSYSTHFNYILGVGGGITYRPFNRIEFQLDGSMNHQSNAALLEPNGGINYWALAFSTNFYFDNPDFHPRDIYDPYLHSEKKKRWDVSFSWGISSMPFPLPGQVPMYSITFLRSIQLWRIFAVSFAAELERNGRAVELSRRGYASETTNPFRGSVLLGGEFLMGRSILTAQMGGYVYRSFKEKDDLYQRWGLAYNIYDDIFVGINFKSYRNSADHLSLRFTYSFR